MISAYPTAFDVWTDLDLAFPYFLAAWMNQLQVNIIAVEATLGLDPQGSFADVNARLTSLEVI